LDAIDRGVGALLCLRHAVAARADIEHASAVRDNVIAVGVRNSSGQGGLKPDVNLDLIAEPKPLAWSRSLFNGLAQIIVRSTRDAGEIKLTASADGLAPTTAVLETTQTAQPPFVP